LAEVAANVVPFKRRAYEAVAREFGPVISARARSGGPEATRVFSEWGWRVRRCLFLPAF
jgi:ribosomal protein L15E